MSDNETRTNINDEASEITHDTPDAATNAESNAGQPKGGLLRIAIAALIILIPLLSVAKDSILEWSSSSGSVPAAKIAIMFGADVNQRFENDTMTPLMVASYEGNASVARTLMEAGADSTMQMDYGQTALYLAVKNGNADVIKTLITSGVDINQLALTGSNNTYYAVKFGWAESVKALLEAGADPNQATRQGYPLLVIAKADAMDEIAQMLLDAGASTDNLDAQIKEYLAERDSNAEKKADPNAMQQLLNIKQSLPK